MLIGGRRSGAGVVTEWWPLPPLTNRPMPFGEAVESFRAVAELKTWHLSARTARHRTTFGPGRPSRGVTGCHSLPQGSSSPKAAGDQPVSRVTSLKHHHHGRITSWHGWNPNPCSSRSFSPAVRRWRPAEVPVYVAVAAPFDSDVLAWRTPTEPVRYLSTVWFTHVTGVPRGIPRSNATPPSSVIRGGDPVGGGDRGTGATGVGTGPVGHAQRFASCPATPAPPEAGMISTTRRCRPGRSCRTDIAGCWGLRGFGRGGP